MCGKFYQGARAATVQKEQERQLGHPLPAGHHELAYPGVGVDILVPRQCQHAWAGYLILVVGFL